MTDSHQPAEGFFYQPSTIRWILRIFYGLSLLLLLADLMVHRHIETSVEKFPGFYAFYGFIACVVLVIIASKMREWLMRDEYYYDAEGSPVLSDATTSMSSTTATSSVNAKPSSTVKKG